MRTFLAVKWRAWVQVCQTHRRHEVGHFSFVNMLFFDYRLLLTRRWKLVEEVMTVVTYWSQQHGLWGQRIDTRKPEIGIMLTWHVHMGEIKLVAFSFSNRIWWFPLAFFSCGVQGKLSKVLVRFWFHCFVNWGFILYTHNEILPVLGSLYPTEDRNL